MKRMIALGAWMLLTACEPTIKVELPSASPVATPVPSATPLVVIATPKPTPPPIVLPTPSPAPVSIFEDESCIGLHLDPMPPQDANGWTKLASPARTIFVSKANIGKVDDVQNGLYFVRTLDEGQKLLRKGVNDALLFARGETFNGMNGLNAALLGGANSLQPMVIGAYGIGARPVIQMPDGTYFLNAVGTLNNIALLGLDLRATRVKGNTEAIRYAGKGGKNWLIEGMRIQGFAQNLDFDSQFDVNGNGIQNLVIRRSQILDAYSLDDSKHSQNMYLDRARGVLLEENVFDHGGYLSRTKAPGLATQFNHNLYIQSLNRCVTFRRNVSMRASATGIQMRAGGIMEDNFLFENPVQMTYGAVNGGSVDEKHLPFGVTGRVNNNVIVMGADISPSQLRNGVSEFGNLKHVEVMNNVFAHHLRGAAAGWGLSFRSDVGIGSHNLLLKQNTVFDLETKLNVQVKAIGSVVLKGDGAGGTGVFRNGVMVVSPAGSGLAGISGEMPIQDATGTTIDDNILQTTMNDFVKLAFSDPAIHVVNAQVKALHFKDPMRSVAKFQNIGSEDAFIEHLRNNPYEPAWSAFQIGAFLRQGFEVAP